MKIGITLSGGGARGMVHLGVLKALDESKIPIDMISGTSAGAVVGAFYAYGYKPDEILDIALKTKIWKLVKPVVGHPGLFSLKMLRPLLETYLPQNFEQLKIPLFVAATNLNQGTTVFFKEGELAAPVIASCTIPVLFTPVKMNTERFVDGGVINNMPVEPIRPLCDFVIGAHCNPVLPGVPLEGMRRIVERTFMLTIAQNAKARFSMCDFLIEPPKSGLYKVYGFNKAEQLFDIGYEYTLEQINKLKNVLIQKGYQL
jgi:NTE family protein